MPNNGKSFFKLDLEEENALLFKEVMVARRASDITAKLVVEQFQKMEEVLHQLEDMVKNEKALREQLSEKLQEAEIREQELARARVAAEAANEAKSAFLASTSHELRTPLTSVLGFAKIIQKRLIDVILPTVAKDDRKVQRAVHQVETNLDIIISEGERLTHLINNVLDLAKIEAGKVEWNMQTIAVQNVIERAVAATTSLFEQTGLKRFIDIQPDLPTIIADQEQLIQVFVNLFSNAVKFTPQGSVTCKACSENGSILISVADTGTGIDPKYHQSVFEQFIQVGDTLTDKPKGTGLGLTISKQIIDHHGGRIWLESRPGQGTTFYIRLPVNAAGAPLAAPDDMKASLHALNISDIISRLKHREDTAAGITSQAKTVLVVDDEAHIRELLRQELESQGYRVCEAADGREAISQVKQNKPDLIILDVMMPEMSGFDVAAVLKNDPETQNIPIVILSIVEDKERGYRIGVDRYFTKPVDMEALSREIALLTSLGESRKHVLVVDKDESALKSISEVLRLKGFDVVEALTAEDCIQKARLLKPDMVILDAMFSKQHDIVKSLRFEKGLENVYFVILAEEQFAPSH